MNESKRARGTTSYVVRRGSVADPLDVKGGGLELRCKRVRKSRTRGKMNLNSRRLKRAMGLLPVLLTGFLLAGCSQTAAPESSRVQQAANETPATGPVSAAPPMQSVAAPYTATGNGQYEEPPVVNAADLLPASLLSGPGYTVQPQVPTNGAMGQYTLVADQSVFHEDAGTYYVQSLELAKIRLSEIPAIAQLDSMSNTDVFARALATSAARPVAAAANMVAHPMDTITGLPGGVGDLFGRVSMGAGQIASSASNSFGSGKAAGQAGKATITALGYDQMRRDLARKLHVDPYTSDPILAKRLNKVAWVMFSARMTVSAAMMAVPGSMIITAVTVIILMIHQPPR